MIDDESNQLGVMTPQDALKIARENNMDLVEVSPTAQPPVCRIMDFGKYLYQQEKREREAKKHQKVITVKEVKFRINVDDHDYETKKNHVLRFLEEGDKVKATIFFRGREMTRTGLGRELSQRLDPGHRRPCDCRVSCLGRKAIPCTRSWLRRRLTRARRPEEGADRSRRTIPAFSSNSLRTGRRGGKPEPGSAAGD